MGLPGVTEDRWLLATVVAEGYPGQRRTALFLTRLAGLALVGARAETREADRCAGMSPAAPSASLEWWLADRAPRCAVTRNSVLASVDAANCAPLHAGQQCLRPSDSQASRVSQLLETADTMSGARAAKGHRHGCDGGGAIERPTEESGTLARRTQQILAEETGVADTADPLGGSYFVEALTDEVERRAWELIEAIEALGGAVTAIERGWVQAQIAESAYAWEQAVERGERIVVGVNRYQDTTPVQVPVHRLDEAAVERQIRRVQEYRARQDAERVGRALAWVEEGARGRENLLPVLREALLAGATLGQICGRLRQVWGEYRPRF